MANAMIYDGASRYIIMMTAIITGIFDFLILQYGILASTSMNLYLPSVFMANATCP